MDPILKQTLLYDFYGELLTKHQKEIYGQYMQEDLSLGEIAQEKGISRQCVHDMVRRCDQSLRGYEEKLHLVERFVAIREKVKELYRILDDSAKEGNGGKGTVPVEQIRSIADEILDKL